ncbi:sulfate adenylyltransferase subunit CysN [Helicobacter sp. 23-1046]
MKKNATHETLHEYLAKHQNKELCRFITCGSVDDGKSTLIGRLLYDSKALFEDQLSALEKESAKIGTQGGNLDFALLVDGLSSEREQGITIDVAYRFFSTEKRKYIIADTPGHEQYTRNMATGASTADIAVILLDARKGVLTQSKRHSYIVSLLGIKHIIVAVNKMDLMEYSNEVFESIVRDYKAIIQQLAYHSDIVFDFIPISALQGENILHKSEKIAWYKGKSLMEILDSAKIHKRQSQNFILPVQFVNRPNLDYRAFCGNIESGEIKVGDSIVALPSNKTSKIKAIVSQDIADLDCKKFDKKALGAVKSAGFPQSVSLVLEDEIDITRGDIIAKKEHSLKLGKCVVADIVWFDEVALELQSSYVIKRATSTLKGSVEQILYKKDINDFTEHPAHNLHLNDIARCVVKFDRTLGLESYNNNRVAGSFIIIDKYTNATLGAGMIVEVVESNVDSTNLAVDSKRKYSPQERALNAFIREHYPEWGCKEI